MTSDVDDAEPPRVYTRRWFVLSIVATSILLRGFNQSCFGPSNNLLANYFNVEPWQIDWLVIVQSVIFLVASLPLSMMTVRLGYRTIVIATTFSQSLGFALTACGLSSRSGFVLAMVGQGLMGFSNIVSWSLTPPTAAIWFAKNEVATAVATQVVARGVGESIGAYLPTRLTNNNATIHEFEMTWKWMYTSLCGLGTLLFILAYLVVWDKPPTPPSFAQMKAEESQRFNENAAGSSTRGLLQELKSSAAAFWRVIKALLSDPKFICVWILFGASNPVLRTNNVLLSSALNKRFTDVTEVNTKVGMTLMIAWGMYTLGGFVTGPIITYTQRYSEVVLVGEIFLFTSCLLVFCGVYFYNMAIIYVGVALQGLMVGSCNTSLFELIAEVSYPQPTMFVTMISIIGMGIFRFLYPILGRFLITNVGATSSELFPCIVTGACVLIAAVLRPSYKRKFANQREERVELLKEIEVGKADDE